MSGRVKLGPREQPVVDLLLQGCSNQEIADELHMAKRTVKAHINRLFVRFGIKGGIKRVQLAVLLYRKQCVQWPKNCTEPASCALATNASSTSFTRD